MFVKPLHREEIERRRLFRRIKGVGFVLSLAALSSYAIIRQTTSPAFSVSRGHDTAAAQSVDRTSVLAASYVPPADSSSSDYRLVQGPYGVAEVPDLVLRDTQRDKDLHVRIFYPSETADGPFPVIVFSHGAGGSETCCDALTRHWASYGYVTLQPTHDDSAQQRRAGGDSDARFLQAVRDALKSPALWESRPRDISFVLDSLPQIERLVPALKGKMNASRIGMSGHSMGAFTTEVLAGARIDLPGRPGTSFADPRIRAALALSPQGPGQFGLTDRSWDGVTLPFMGVTGSLDSLGPIASPEWHKAPFERSQSGDKYHVFIQAANHFSFITARTLVPGRAAKGQAIFDDVQCAALAFWDAYLKDDPNAKHYLASDALAKFSGGAATLDRR
jgi:predicted dienelactone hydrolase